MIRLQYLARYYWRRMKIALGICPECRNQLVTKPSGRKFCPFCGRSGL